MTKQALPRPNQDAPKLYERTWFHACLIVGLSCIVFYNCLQNGFHTDDYYLVRDNPGIRQISQPWLHFVDPSTQSTLPQLRGYRPLLPLSLSLNYALAGNSLVGYHLVNLGLHVATAWLVHLLIVRMLALAGTTLPWSGSRAHDRTSRMVALCVALLYAVHPVSGFSVNYICGRDQPISQLFWLAALLVYVRMRTRRVTVLGWLACLALMTLSLMTKMYAAVAPAFILWLEVTLFREPLTRARPWLRAALFTLPLAALFTFQRLVIGYLPEFQNNLRGSGHSFEWAYTLTQARLHLWRYLPNFVWPLPIRQDPWEPLATGLDARVVSGLVFIAASLIAAWRWRRTRPTISLCIVAYWLLMATTSSIAPLFYAAADYRPYLSSPFLFLALALVVMQLHPLARRGIAVAAIAWCSVTSIYLNETWRTDISMWTHSVEYGGGALAHHNLAMATPDLRKRKELLEKALELSPYYSLAKVNLGRLLITLGEKKRGLDLVQDAARHDARSMHVRYWYARTLVEQGDRKRDAAHEADAAAQLDHHNRETIYQAVLALQAVKNHTRALYWLDELQRLTSSTPDADFARGFSLQELGRNAEAIAVYRRFLAQNPDHVQARFNLAYALVHTDDCATAVPEFERVLALAPDRASAHYHIAHCAQAAGDTASAQQHQLAWERRPRPRK